MKKIILLFMFILTGCASSSFTCGEYPSGKCKSVSTVYKETQNDWVDYRKTNVTQKKNSKDFKLNLSKPTPLSVPLAGKPLLSKPKILRILVTQWIDEDNDFNGGGYLYVKVRDSEWIH